MQQNLQTPNNIKKRFILNYGNSNNNKNVYNFIKYLTQLIIYVYIYLYDGFISVQYCC